MGLWAWLGDLLVMFRLRLTRLEIETYLIWTRVAPSLASLATGRPTRTAGLFLNHPSSSGLQYLPWYSAVGIDMYQ